MAKHNPFSIFRRNQRAWMAGLTLFTMFSFIALGSMLQCVGSKNEGGPRYTGKVASTQKFGELDYNEFLVLRQDAYRLSLFLESVARAARELQAQPSDALTTLSMEMNIAKSNADALVDRWLIGKFAAAEKMQPSNAAAIEYLKLLTTVVRYNADQTQEIGSLPADALQYCMRSAGYTDTTLVDALKSQIAFDRYIRKADAGRRMDPWYNQSSLAQIAYGHGEPLSTPADALEAYDALNRQAKAKVAVFKASDYVAEVADPSEAKLQALYEQYKDVVFHADSDRPGFTQPTKIALEIVRAELTDEVLDAIPMEDVRKYYEEHKEEFRIPKRTTAPAAPESPLPEVETLSIPEDALNAIAAPAEEAPAPAEEAPAPAEEAAYITSATQNLYAQEAETEAAPAEEVAPAEEAAPAEEVAPAEEAAPAEEVEYDYMDFENVELIIRRRIAAERLNAKMAEINGKLQDYYRATISAKETQEPQKVNLKALAEENGLQYLVTNLPDGESSVPVMISQDEASIMAILPESELQTLYESAPLPYAPRRVGNYDPADPMSQYRIPDEFYVYRAIDVKAQYRPEFEEARDTVLETYKLLEGAKIAEKKAQEFYAQASAEGADFDKLAADSKAQVVETEKFSWFKPSYSAYGASAEPSEIREAGVEAGQADRDNKAIVAPGWDFYETLFGLDLNGVGICRNQSKDRSFVLKVVEKDGDELISDSFDQIATDQSASYVQMMMRRARVEKFHEDFMKELRDDSGFNWLWIPQVEEGR